MAIISMIATSAWSQRNCGTMEHLQMQLQQDPSMAQRMQEIETFTQNYIANHPSGERTVITVPVVFHILYNTTAQNITDAKVLAQIDQLNADYARLNSDAGNTPSVFASLAANCEVQFCLAQRDPSGNATNGIIHKSTTVSSFSSNDNIKHNNTNGDDAWSSSSYLNIWSGNLGGGLLGYAQFPGGPASTDGVVVLYSSVGSIASPGTLVPYNYGRTATHEVGHWLNLFHIWGDSNCGNDQVGDTPTQQTNNFGCPSFPHVTNCSGNAPNGDMFMNYMDYTDDGCMNMFSAGQKTRMQALFTSGGSRFSIVSSQGCVPPNGGSCGTPSGLNATSITTSSATLNWSSVSGATSYNVQYRVVGNATWTSTTSTTTSKAISSLISNTQYEFQAQAVCTSGSSAFSASAAFTTLTSGGNCTNTPEPNNTKGTASAVTIGTDLLSQLGSSTDVDWYSFVNTSTNHNIKITLSTLPADYEIRLYTNSGTQVGSSLNGGTADETIIYNTSTVGTYKIKVYGFHHAFSTTQCYTLHVYTSASPFRVQEGAQDAASMNKSAITVFPNPALDNISVQFSSDAKENVALNVYNLVGQKMYSTTLLALEGQNIFTMSVSSFDKGAYIVEVVNGDEALRKEFVIAK